MDAQLPPAVILFLAANPDGETRLSLDRECRTIRERIRLSDFPRALDLKTEWAVRPDDLLQYLNEFRPQVVHFSGHGSDREELILHDADDQPVSVSVGALRALFATLQDNVRLVVLNACFSQPQAEAIVDRIDCAIGMTRAIGDEAAIVFASSFYSALGFGRSVQNAFDQGCTALLLHGIPEESTPRLLVKSGVDPNRVFLVESATNPPVGSSDTARRAPVDPTEAISEIDAPQSLGAAGEFNHGKAGESTGLHDPPGGARRRGGIVMWVFVALAILASMVVWQHELAEGRRPMLVVAAKHEDLKTVADRAENSLRARLASLGEGNARDERWFPALGTRPGLTLTATFSNENCARVRLELTAARGGSHPYSAYLLFGRGLLSEHVDVVGDPILKALHVDASTGHLVAANEVDPDEGDSLLRNAAGLSSQAGAPQASAPDCPQVVTSPATVVPASANSQASAAVAASAPASNTQTSGAGVTAEQQSAGDPRPLLFVTHLKDAVKASQAVVEHGHSWVDTKIGDAKVTRVRAAFFDAARFTVRVVLSKNDQGSHVQDVTAPAGSVFIMNGGEYRNVPPKAPNAARVSIGFIYSDGKLVSNEDAAYSKGPRPRGGLFALRASAQGDVRTVLLPRRAVGGQIDINALGQPKDLLQAKWTLIHPNLGSAPCGASTVPAVSGGVQGICRHDADKIYARSAFCTRGSEFGFVMVTGHAGLSLYQFMNLLEAPRADGGFACETALNLDGADTIQFRRWGGAASRRSLLDDHRSDRPVANFLAVTTR